MQHLRILLFQAVALLIVVSFVFSAPLPQIDSVKVNGKKSGSLFTTGDEVTWQIFLNPAAAGATVDNEIWLDVNANGIVEPGIDKNLFVFFSQKDGPGQAGDAPPDMDFTVNGVIITTLRFGFAPGNWIFVSKYNYSAAQASFTVNPLTTFATQLSGTVTVPAGESKENIFLSVEPVNKPQTGYPVIWFGKTDANGNYSVKFPTSPHESFGVYLDFNRQRYHCTPSETTVWIGDTAVVVNYTLAAGQIIRGMVTSSGLPLSGATVFAKNTDGGPDGRTVTGTDGTYQMVVDAGWYILDFSKKGYIQRWHYYNTGSFDSTVTLPWYASSVYVGSDMEGADTVIENANLERGGLIRGRVTQYGEPVSAGIYFQNNLGGGWQYYTHTREDGRYEIVVPPDTYYINFQSDLELFGGSLWYDQSWNEPYDQLRLPTVNDTISNVNADFGLPPELQPIKILGMNDVPNDNGKQMMVTWKIQFFNELIYLNGGSVSLKLDHYAPDRVRSAAQAVSEGPYYGEVFFTVLRKDGNSWTQVGPSIALQNDSIYSAVVPSLFDSTKSKGIFWTKYKVSCHFSAFIIPVFTTRPDSGYSIDNIAPIPPAGVTSKIQGNDLIVSWNAPVQGDEVVAYRIYRSTTPQFQIGPATLYRDGLKTTSFTDVGVVGSTMYYYKLTAVDDAENESAPASFSSTTSVADMNMMPTEFVVHQNYPNPFNPATTIAYDLPEARHVTLKVYNTLGQEVAVLADGYQSAGRYSKTFEASHLASGLYIYRLTAGPDVSIKKMSLIK